MKKLIVVTIMMLSVFVLIGCTSVEQQANEVKAEEVEATETFEVVLDQKVVGGNDAIIIREAKTDVLYLMLEDWDGELSGVTMMCSPDGTPLTYSEWISISE